MKTWDVTFLVTVEAETEDEAIQLAEDALQQSSDSYAVNAEEREAQS